MCATWRSIELSERKLERKEQQGWKRQGQEQDWFSFWKCLGTFGRGRGTGKGKSKSKGKDKSKGKGKSRSKGKDKKGQKGKDNNLDNNRGGCWNSGDPSHYAKNCPQSRGRVNQVEGDGGWTNDSYNCNSNHNSRSVRLVQMDK